MRILHYNFAQPNDMQSGAGGVGVYLRSVVEQLAELGHEVICLSSGLSYTPALGTPSLASWKMPDYQALDIVDSPVVSPMYFNFFSLDTYLESSALDHIPQAIKEHVGSVDAFHFHNLEGLTRRFFYQLKLVFPETFVMMSAHNYSLVCPQVNLWRYDRESCNDFEEGRACVSCIGYEDAEYQKRLKAYYAFQYDSSRKRSLLARFKAKTKLEAPNFSTHFDSSRKAILSPGLSSKYKTYRHKNIELAHDVFDCTLAVSHRTKAVLVARGMRADDVDVSYIGSKHVYQTSDRRQTFSDLLRVTYIGYPRRDKGFFFLLDALEDVPHEVGAKVALTIVSSVEQGQFISRVGSLARRFADVQLINGYKAEDLRGLLETTDLGIVPPLWEDNLPQVAIEYVAYGVPILVGDLGGAYEIAQNPDFVFSAGSKPSFIRALSRIVEREVELSSFWRNEPNVRTPSAHVDELVSRYKGSLRPSSSSTGTGLIPQPPGT